MDDKDLKLLTVDEVRDIIRMSNDSIRKHIRKGNLKAKKCGVKPHAIAIGSFARKIVKKYLNMADILENEKALNEAVQIAKSLIDISLGNMAND